MLKIKKKLLGTLCLGLVFSSVFSTATFRMASVLSKNRSLGLRQIRNASSFDIHQKDARFLDITHRVYGLLGVNIAQRFENQELLEMLYVANVMLGLKTDPFLIESCRYPLENAIRPLIQEFNVFTAHAEERLHIKKMLLETLESYGIDEMHFMIVFGIHFRNIREMLSGEALIRESLWVYELAEEHVNNNFVAQLTSIAEKKGFTFQELATTIFIHINKEMDTTESVEVVANRIARKIIFHKNL